MAAPEATKKPPCLNCKHYFITWDQYKPHGCRSFRFKSAILPCYDVQIASNLNCLKFEAKPARKPNG